MLNDLDRDVKAAQQNLYTAQEQQRQISAYNIDLKEKNGNGKGTISNIS